jgi:hypothetical protein
VDMPDSNLLVLSDGNPTTVGIEDENELLEELMKCNITSPLRIIGGNDEEKNEPVFMGNIIRCNFGTYNHTSEIEQHTFTVVMYHQKCHTIFSKKRNRK